MPFPREDIAQATGAWYPLVGGPSARTNATDAIRVLMPAAILAKGFETYIGIAAAGNVDFGLYDSSGMHLLMTTGPVAFRAVVGASLNYLPALAHYQITPGWYWLVCSSDDVGIGYGFTAMGAAVDSKFGGVGTPLPADISALPDNTSVNSVTNTCAIVSV